ncbi:MAG TPA: diadenylate cyclase CdaA [bacterium]|nr:diadenylate cyclase CdaA [bacterium]
MLAALRSIDAGDIFEIVVIWVAFYYIYVLIRGTRAIEAIKGLAWLAAITIIADWLQLQLISWVMNKLWTTFIVVLVVLFHPEIRRALARLGERRFFNFALPEKEQEQEVIEEVARAAQRLSNERIGALIAFERETALKGHITAGVKLDARVTTELLHSIFFPKTALHDGAVLVAKGRVVLAGCILPLPAAHTAIDQKYGTRHRAAIGLSQETDACVVVVSEETGTISIVMKGNITTDLTEESLREMLTLYVGGGELGL